MLWLAAPLIGYVVIGAACAIVAAWIAWRDSKRLGYPVREGIGLVAAVGFAWPLFVVVLGYLWSVDVRTRRRYSDVERADD